MRSRVFHIAAAIISVLSVAVLSAAPVQAGPIHFADVVQIINGSKNGGQNVSLQLRNGSQSGRVQAASQAGPQSPAGTSSTGSASTASLISTIAAPQQGGASGLESIDQGDIEGTICDCGELALAGGGFPL
ncbi:MAG TPA: hypothetical protein VD966_02850, partial [Pyrinomonadaceae bacterium]|nr:hypothetical protein [Pyrinomonadaceae bacterium]